MSKRTSPVGCLRVEGWPLAVALPMVIALSDCAASRAAPGAGVDASAMSEGFAGNDSMSNAPADAATGPNADASDSELVTPQVEAGDESVGASLEGGLPVDGGLPTGPISPYGPGLVPLFDGVSLSGWTVVVDGKVTNANPTQWSVVDGAMRSTGANRNFIYTQGEYGDFRLIFTSRLISDLADGATPHVPCVLFCGTSVTADAMDALQIQPPKGYMWDYRQTGPTANQDPQRYETHLADPKFSDAEWSQCEMLANKAAGTMRFACCQLTGTTPCKAVELVDFRDPTAGQLFHLALQTHTGNNATGTGQIEEFKDLYIESPVADPTRLLTTQ